MRILAATLGAPIIFALSFASLAMFSMSSTTHQAVDFGVFIVLAIYLTIVDAALVVALALPLHAALYRSNFRKLPAYLACGALAGMATTLALGASNLLDFFNSDFGKEPPVGLALAPWFMPSGVLAGTLNSLLFWLIRRPDRDHDSNAASNSTSA